jgi:RNA polymerase sigma-70 factor (ECF subfamily)
LPPQTTSVSVQPSRPDGLTAADAAAEDAALLSRLRSGDPSAYDDLVRMHTGRLLAVTRRMLNSEDDAKDAVQDAFLSAFRGLASFEGGSLLSTWLHRIAVNAALMKLRTRRRKPERSIETLLPSYLEDGHHAEDFQDWNQPVDRAMMRAEMRAMVRKCIGELPDNYRTVLILRDIEELDTDETAERLGLTPNAVKIRLHRARQALRTLLDPHFRSVQP